MASAVARPSALTSEGLAAEALVKSDGLDFSFAVGVFRSTPESEHLISVAIIAESSGRFLVALPVRAWDKVKAKRVLPQPVLDRPVSAAIVGCTAEDRLTPSGHSYSTQVWVGYLKKEFWSCVTFGSELQPTLDFEDTDSGDSCYPFAGGLVDLAVEKGFIPPPLGGPGESQRLQSLEDRFAGLEKGVQDLLSEFQRDRGDGGFVTPGEEGARASVPPVVRKSAFKKPTSKAVAAPPGLAPAVELPGLDAGAVAAALQAGIPMEQLEVLSGVLKARPSKLGDYPRPEDHQRAVVSSESEDGIPEEEEHMEEHGGQPEDPVAKALVQLTKIVSNLSKSRKKDKGLEETLDQVGEGSGLGDVSSSMGRKHAAARQALLKAFRQDPKLIWQTVEQNMAEDFHLQSSLPSSGALTFSARGWCEHRSRIQPFIRTLRWVWGIAGVLDNLRESNYDQARARCGLLLAAAEQESLDHGSFLLSQEFLMEPSVPLSSFQGHTLPDQTEMVTTRLIDPRWVEAFADRLKQVDNYVELRKKLNLRGRPAPGIGDPPKAPGKGGGKGKGNTKSKTETSQTEA